LFPNWDSKEGHLETFNASTINNAEDSNPTIIPTITWVVTITKPTKDVSILEGETITSITPPMLLRV